MRATIERFWQGEAASVLRGLAAYGSAEVANRVVRVFAVIIIARRIDATALGLAALALSLFELIRVLAGAGIGQRIVAAAAADLDATCNRAHRLFWLWCSLVALVQLLVAAIVAFGFGLGQSGAMLAVLSGVYLLMPAGLVQVFLLQRARKLGTTARIGATQTIADHILTMTLAILWPSAWAIVLPKLLTTPIWLVLVRRAQHWRANPAAGLAPLSDFVRYGAGVIGSELATAARMQLGNLVIGATLGVQALGTFFFAFGAGLGITSSFVAAFSTVLFPHFCNATTNADRATRYVRGMLLGLAVFLPIAFLQVRLAPVYVPILFGARWASAAPLVSILGVAAVPMVLSAATTAWLRATERAGTDAAINLAACIAALGGLAIGAQIGLAGAAYGFVGGLAAILVPSSLYFSVRAAMPTLSPSLTEQFA